MGLVRSCEKNPKTFS